MPILGVNRGEAAGLFQSRLATIDLTGERPVVFWCKYDSWPLTGQVGAPGMTLEKRWA